MAAFPYIPPRSPMDPPSPELVILFLEAVSRTTLAFKELRDKILPLCDSASNHMPVAEIEDWLLRWHLDFEDGDGSGIGHMIYSWVFQILHWWERDRSAAAELRVDQDWWDRDPLKRNIHGDGIIKIALSKWNPAREDDSTYRARVITNLSSLVEKHISEQKNELAKYDAKPYRKRAHGRDLKHEFEWVALHVCKGKSDGQIAIQYRSKAATVKQGRIRLSRELGIIGDGDISSG